MDVVILFFVNFSLKTKDGVTTIAFTHSLSGHPEDPLHPLPAPTQRRRRHRGPARRERDRQRAARHQAAQMSQAGASPASPLELWNREVGKSGKV